MSDQGEPKSQDGRRVAGALVELFEKTGSQTAMLHGAILGTCMVGLVAVSTFVADPFLLYPAGGILICGMGYSLFELFRTGHQIRKREMQRAAEEDKKREGAVESDKTEDDDSLITDKPS